MFLNKAWCCTQRRVNTRSDVGKANSWAFFQNWNLDGDPAGGQHTWSTVPQATNIDAVGLGRIHRISEALLAADLTPGSLGGFHRGRANLVFADGSARSLKDSSWLTGLAGTQLDPGPTVTNEYIIPNWNAASPQYGIKGFAY